ncbi:hypothetical protein Leryth_023043 [Lithospermum erythrorhizon]|nr:hypothetical protein Leryth_023043 [Lithospermum erythrorhizon]
MENASWVVSFPYLLFSIAFPLIIYAIFFKNGRSNLPPGSNGWPIIGETIHFFISGPDKFISDRMKKHSTQVFRTSFVGQKVVVFCGPGGNKFVFNNTQNNVLSLWFPPTLAKIVRLEQDFMHRISASPGSSQLLNHTFHEILKTDSLKLFISIFNEITRDHVKNEWKDGREVKVFPLSNLFCFSVACRFLMGISDTDEIKTLASSFDEVKSGFFSVPIDLPGTTFRRAINAGKIVNERVSKIIQRRRKDLQESENEQGLDLLSQVLKIAPGDTNEESQYNSDLRSIIVGILLASTSSPASAITFTLKYLTEMPHIHNQVYQEQMEITKSKGEEDYLTWDDLKKMEYTWNVVREVLRVMTPFILGGFREVKSDLTYAGFTIPKGWKVLWTTQTSHKDPKYFENPEEFNPSRFKSSIHEPYSYVPFGGGRGICPGRDFFKLYMLIFIHNIVTKFKLEKLDPNEGIKYQMTPFPVNGFPVRLVHR